MRGSWADQWCPETSPIRQHEALATSQGQDETSAHLGISLADEVTAPMAGQFLQKALDAFNERPEPRGSFRTDITHVAASSENMFHWPYYVQHCKWYFGCTLPARETHHQQV